MPIEIPFTKKNKKQKKKSSFIQFKKVLSKNHGVNVDFGC